jgi:hypothetical protein
MAHRSQPLCQPSSFIDSTRGVELCGVPCPADEMTFNPDGAQLAGQPIVWILTGANHDVVHLEYPRGVVYTRKVGKTLGQGRSRAPRAGLDQDWN